MPKPPQPSAPASAQSAPKPAEAASSGLGSAASDSKLPKVESIGIVKREHLWHVFAVRTQGNVVLDMKLLDSGLPSEVTAKLSMQLEVEQRHIRDQGFFD